MNPIRLLKETYAAVYQSKEYLTYLADLYNEIDAQDSELDLDTITEALILYSFYLWSDDVAAGLDCLEELITDY